MKILFLLFSLLLLQPAFATETAKQGDFSGAKTVELPDWFKTTFLDFGDDLQEANDKNRHLMIYFHQNGCPYCSKLVEDNFHNEALVSKLKQHFDAIQINIWGNRELTDWQGDEFSEKQFAQKMKIQFTPTLVFLSPKGESLLRINGYQSVEKMHKILDFISNKNYLKQSFADFISNENQPKKAKNALHKNPIFDTPPHLLFRSKTLPAQQYLAVFFESPNCQECDLLHQNLAKSPELKKMFEQMQVVQLNLQSGEKLITPAGKKTTAKKWYEALNLTYSPALVFFAKTGEEIIRKDAAFRRFHFEAIIDYALSGSYKNQPNFQRYIEQRADKIRASGVDVNIWQQQQF